MAITDSLESRSAAFIALFMHKYEDNFPPAQSVTSKHSSPCSLWFSDCALTSQVNIDIKRTTHQLTSFSDVNHPSTCLLTSKYCGSSFGSKQHFPRPILRTLVKQMGQAISEGNEAKRKQSDPSGLGPVTRKSPG